MFLLFAVFFPGELPVRFATVDKASFSVSILPLQKGYVSTSTHLIVNSHSTSYPEVYLHTVSNTDYIYEQSIGRVSYLIYVSMLHCVLTTSGDIVVCFHTAVCSSY